MTDLRVAFLRGINVGTAKRIAMADLRAVVEALGYRDVRTVLNSGNVIFTVPPSRSGDAAARIENAIARRLSVASRVTVLKGADVAAAVLANPFARVATDPSRLQVMVVADAAIRARLEALLTKRWSPEAVAAGVKVVYLWCPQGIIDSPLMAAVSRIVGDAGTVRNMATMTRIQALIERT